jgi:hypothetical protein
MPSVVRLWAYCDENSVGVCRSISSGGSVDLLFCDVYAPRLHSISFYIVSSISILSLFPCFFFVLSPSSVETLCVAFCLCKRGLESESTGVATLSCCSPLDSGISPYLNRYLVAHHWTQC